MSKTKKVIANILEGGLEVVKDSAAQLGQTISPDSLVKHALRLRSGGSEFTDYLKKSAPNVTPEELAKKEAAYGLEAKKQEQEAKRTIQAAIPDHMKPLPAPTAPRPYVQTVQEQERKKAQVVEAQQKQSKAVVLPVSPKKTPGLPVRIRKSTSEGLVKDMGKG